MNGLAFLLVENDTKIEEAESLAQRALQKAPQDADFQDTLGLIYVKKNNEDTAVRVFENLVVHHRENALYHYHFGLALFQAGQKDKARAELEAALPKKPSEKVRKGIESALAKIR